MAERHQKRTGHRQSMGKVINRVGHQIQIASYLDRSRLLALLGQETTIRHIFDVTRSAILAAVLADLSGRHIAVRSSHQATGDVDAFRLRIRVVVIHVSGEDLLDYGEDQDAGEHPETAAN